MGRHKTVDREHVLDVAERIVAARGAGSLTIGQVADAAGISKGGVQSTFGTKEALIAAMMERWLAHEQQRFKATLGEDMSDIGRVRAHVETTRSHDEASHARAAGMLAALMQSPEHLATTRAWYAERLGDLSAPTADKKRARIALLATEGAFFLRFLGLYPIEQNDWDGIFADLEQTLTE